MPEKTPKADLRDARCYINRELSWLEFNNRVLEEGLSAAVPLMERLKFLAIVSSNLDEFFMIRVAGLKHQAAEKIVHRDPSGLTPADQLREISALAHRIVEHQDDGIRNAIGKLAESGLDVAAPAGWTPPEAAFVARYWTSQVLPILTPLAVAELNPFPTLPGRLLNVAVALQPKEKPEDPAALAVVAIPSSLPRFVQLPAEKGLRLARIEDIFHASIEGLFPGMKALASVLFRLTRDAEVSVDDEAAQDLLEVMEQAIRSRRRRGVVRLEISSNPDPRILQWLLEWCAVKEEDVYRLDAMLDATGLMELVARPGFASLRDPPWPPQPARDLVGASDLWEAIRDHDVLLFHPYESFDPVVRLLQDAADDPTVLAIKQTLYRTSGDSPIIAALLRAAEKGRQVTVLVELKARFEESRNISWARRLEDAGCQVIYGIAAYKTHGKALLIIRREPHGIRRYLHLSTGNYNDRTARLYSDIGLMTCDADLAADASAFFNLLTGYSQDVGWNKFVLAPTGMRQRFLDLIEREIQASTPEQPGLIMAKMNSLEDREICEALYVASRAGVRVQLNVRGICCLRPGLPDVSENIEVISIVDRFLEHARIYYFRNGGNDEVYLSSADWMRRNLDRRLEILFPVTRAAPKRRLMDILAVYFADNVKARALQPDGTYARVKRKGRPVRAQEQFYSNAIEPIQRPPTEFRPLMHPGESKPPAPR
jgi:polyphosphate kinase